MGVIAREHRDEWVSYCPHVDDETGAQACQCAPDLREVVEERDAAQQQLKGAVEALERIAAYPLGDPLPGREANKIARAALGRDPQPPRGQ